MLATHYPLLATQPLSHQCNQPPPTVDRQLSVDRPQLLLDGQHTLSEPIRRLLIAASLTDQEGDFAFAYGKSREPPDAACALGRRFAGYEPVLEAHEKHWHAQRRRI